MSLARPYRQNGGHFRREGVSSYARNSNMGLNTSAAVANGNYNYNFDHHLYNTNCFIREHDFPHNFVLDGPKYDQIRHDVVPSSKKRKLSALPCEITARPYQQQRTYLNQAGERKLLPFIYMTDYTNSNLTHEKSAPVGAETRSDGRKTCARTALKRDRSTFEDDEVVMSRDEIDRLSPSRKDGIDAFHETHLRYSYCTFLQNLGARLDLPQTTIGTAMVLCHRFFVRRSHASHDRFLIATATLFLAAKSEETARPLNDVVKVSCELLYRQDFTLLSCMFPIDWFEQYRERITESEQLILTTLNFELNVQHPYESLTSTLQKLGFSQSVLVNMALHLVSEGVCRGLACSPYDINIWRLMCCSSHVFFSSEVEIEMWMPFYLSDIFMIKCSLAIKDSLNILICSYGVSCVGHFLACSVCFHIGYL